MSQFNASQFNATTTIDAAYNAVFEKGHGTISVEYRTVSGQWLLNSFYVNSPLLSEPALTQKCPYCGHLNPASAKFCENCGKPLKKAKAVPAAPTKHKLK
jgi:zinc-ribbon domain